jgi:hypothetical protein
MSKPPKKYYAHDLERQRLFDELKPYLKHPHVPTGATRGVVQALLVQLALHVPHLNVEAAAGHLMADLLFDNKVLEDAKKRSEELSTEFQTPEENATAEQLLMDELLCEPRGSGRVKKVLEEYSSHSTDRMREESDEILTVLKMFPRDNRNKTDWLNAILPGILQTLKLYRACFTGCRANTTWPPADEDALQRILAPEESQGDAALKNEILAYFHGLDADSVRRYLEGKRPKTVSRSSRRQS